EHGILCALEQGVLARDLQLRGIVAVAGVEDFLFRSDRIDERGALQQRRGHGAPVGAAVGLAVNRRGAQAELAAGHATSRGWKASPRTRTSRRSASRSSADRARESAQLSASATPSALMGPRSATQ